MASTKSVHPVIAKQRADRKRERELIAASSNVVRLSERRKPSGTVQLIQKR